LATPRFGATASGGNTFIGDVGTLEEAASSGGLGAVVTFVGSSSGVGAVATFVGSSSGVGAVATFVGSSSADSVLALALPGIDGAFTAATRGAGGGDGGRVRGGTAGFAASGGGLCAGTLGDGFAPAGLGAFGGRAVGDLALAGIGGGAVGVFAPAGAGTRGAVRLRGRGAFAGAGTTGLLCEVPSVCDPRAADGAGGRNLGGGAIVISGSGVAGAVPGPISRSSARSRSASSGGLPSPEDFGWATRDPHCRSRLARTKM
jgi:hypothetical protein